MTVKLIPMCEFTGDENHAWNEDGYKKKCEHLGFARCNKYDAVIVETYDGWRKCCDQCEQPVYLRPIKV